jgi:hypothetical protein
VLRSAVASSAALAARHRARMLVVMVPPFPGRARQGCGLQASVMS